jgi:hypothetical protein
MVYAEAFNNHANLANECLKRSSSLCSTSDGTKVISSSASSDDVKRTRSACGRPWAIVGAVYRGSQRIGIQPSSAAHCCALGFFTCILVAQEERIIEQVHDV